MSKPALTDRNLQDPDIARAIQERLDDLSMSAAEATKRMTDIARGALHPFMRADDDGRIWFNLASGQAQKHLHLIKKIKQKRKRDFDQNGESGWETEWVEIELHDAKDALKEILKVRGAYAPERKEITGEGGGPVQTQQVPWGDLTDEQLEQLASGKASLEDVV